MSRGETPREFKAAATFSTVGSSGSVTIVPLSSLTLVSVCGVTTVWPVRLNGVGCETLRVEAMLMVRLPWEIAQLEM